jgi:hypothetical protein
VGTMIGMKFGASGEAVLSKFEADLILLLICCYVAAFAWSWGPLTWLLPSEICPPEIRSAGQAIDVSVNMLFTFVIAQAFLAMLCSMKFGLFSLFAIFVNFMTIFIYFFLPETKNVPIEEMNTVESTLILGNYTPFEIHFSLSFLYIHFSKRNKLQNIFNFLYHINIFLLLFK